MTPADEYLEIQKVEISDDECIILRAILKPGCPEWYFAVHVRDGVALYVEPYDCGHERAAAEQEYNAYVAKAREQLY